MTSEGENASFEPGVANLAVQYEKAHFRCEQDVEGFFRVEGEVLDVLVQPTVMHPVSVAGCDCAYGITFSVEPLAAGTFQATLYRRWDGLNSPNEPVEIGSARVVIE